MVIYEVNVEVNCEIFADYYRWLLDHVKVMLTFPGFMQAEIGLIDDSQIECKKLRVSYLIDSFGHLQQYLNHYAPSMRQQGVTKFGEHFSATRRILLNVERYHT